MGVPAGRTEELSALRFGGRQLAKGFKRVDAEGPQPNRSSPVSLKLVDCESPYRGRERSFRERAAILEP